MHRLQNYLGEFARCLVGGDRALRTFSIRSPNWIMKASSFSLECLGSSPILFWPCCRKLSFMSFFANFTWHLQQFLRWGYRPLRPLLNTPLTLSNIAAVSYCTIDKCKVTSISSDGWVIVYRDIETSPFFIFILFLLNNHSQRSTAFQTFFKKLQLEPIESVNRMREAEVL